MQIFLDESGYTGQDLLNPDQPAFCVATIGFREDECAALKARFFGGVRAAELKYSRLCKRPSQQRMVLNFLRDVVPREPLVKVSIAHKEFVVAAKLVDLITEKAMRLDGINLYEGGANIGLAQLTYFGVPAACGRDYFARLLATFQAAALDPSWEAFTAFREVLFDPSLNEDQRKWLAWFQAPIVTHGYEFFRDAVEDEPFELAFPSSSYLMQRWRYDHRDADLELVHDHSSNMVGLEHLWGFLMSDERPPFDRDHGDGRTTVFPVGLLSTTFADSKRWAGLQLADVVAGAYSDAARFAIRKCPGGDPYRDELWHEIVQPNPGELALWPNPDPGQLRSLAGSDVDPDLEYVTKQLEESGLNLRRRCRA